MVEKQYYLLMEARDGEKKASYIPIVLSHTTDGSSGSVEMYKKFSDGMERVSRHTFNGYQQDARGLNLPGLIGNELLHQLRLGGSLLESKVHVGERTWTAHQQYTDAKALFAAYEQHNGTNQ